MTEKRFEISDYSDKLYDLENKNKYYFEDMADWHKICKLLNEQDEKIKELEEEIKSLTDNLEEDYIIVKRDKNPIETKYCHDCWNYEIEYEEVYAFGEYETLSKAECCKGHWIIDDTEANECEDYDPKD